jgi:hypothetical protein
MEQQGSELTDMQFDKDRTESQQKREYQIQREWYRGSKPDLIFPVFRKHPKELNEFNSRSTPP